MKPSIQPPAGLAPHQVPQFVSFTFDDNGKSGAPGSGTIGGMSFVLDLFSSRKNPDGSKTLASFYNAGFYGVRGQWEDPVYTKQLWRRSYLDGHEIGNHTLSHPHGKNSNFGPQDWTKEMDACTAVLEGADVAIPREEITGFRAPFLGYNDATFTALGQLGFRYDCSLMEGQQPDQDGSNNYWPYTLDQGSPGDPGIGSHPGLWEMPTYAIVTPPDEACTRYGLEPGFRARLRERQGGFSIESGKIPGLDWNLWSDFQMSREEFVASFCHTFDQKFRGNRSPMIFCTHSDIYADDYDDPMPGANGAERRAALKDCYDYVLQFQDVRVWSARQIMDWMEAPEAL